MPILAKTAKKLGKSATPRSDRKELVMLRVSIAKLARKLKVDYGDLCFTDAIFMFY